MSQTITTSDFYIIILLLVFICSKQLCHSFLVVSNKNKPRLVSNILDPKDVVRLRKFDRPLVLVQSSVFLEDQVILPEELELELTSNDPVGPSPLVKNLNQDEMAFIRSGVLGEDEEIEFTVSKLSSSPHVYLVKNLLSPSECNTLMRFGRRMNDDGQKERASVTDGDAAEVRSNCTVSWVENDSKSESLASILAAELGRVVGNIFLTDDVKSKGWCEALQLVHYFATGGKFDLHHDGLGRGVTILYYLNGVGNTWFPFADIIEDHESERSPSFTKGQEINSRDQAIQLVQELKLQPGKDGILVAGQNSKVWSELGYKQTSNVRMIYEGDAIVFFNYKTDLFPINGNNDQEAPSLPKLRIVRDWKSIHAGLPTTAEEGEKWICNHWIHYEKFKKDWVSQTY